MRSMRRHLSASIRLALTDTREVQVARVMTGLLVNATALIIAAVATGRLVALWTIVAYPVLMAATYLSYLVRRLRGWNRLWRPEARPVSPADRQVLPLALISNQPPALLLGRWFEVACVVRDPLGAEYETKDVQLNRGRFSCQYPDMFGKVPALRQARYEVTWREEKPVGSGRWHLMDRSSVHVPAWAPAPKVSGSAGP
jgi:hypothetical protein